LFLHIVMCEFTFMKLGVCADVCAAEMGAT